MLMHTGQRFQRSADGLLTTSAAQTTTTPAYALEGSVFVGGAVVQWLRDGLRAINSSSAVQALAESVPDSDGVVVVPAFTALSAAYLAGLHAGVYQGTAKRAQRWQVERRFEPQPDRAWAAERMVAW